MHTHRERKKKKKKEGKKIRGEEKVLENCFSLSLPTILSLSPRLTSVASSIAFIGTILLEKHARRAVRNEACNDDGVGIGYTRWLARCDSRSYRIHEKRAELTGELVYVKSSTVIDSLPASTLL